MQCASCGVENPEKVIPSLKIRARYRAWEDSGNTGLIIQTNQDEAIELMAEVADLNRTSS